VPSRRAKNVRQPRSPERRQRGTLLARSLATAREKKRWTQEQLADASHVSVDAIRRIEQAADPNRRDETVTREPGFFIVADLARGLGLRLDQVDRSSRKGKS
jgi:transcriptional regulator with XRE-family HTH domain